MSVEFVNVYLGLGSNLGDRRQNLKKALEYLSQRLRITNKSSVYQTEPIGNTHQPEFINMVLEAKTMLKPNDLLLLIKGIERKMGRQPGGHNAPRIIDIDILLYGDEKLVSPSLTVPHPHLTQRAFVLVPLNEIAPELKLPHSSKTISRLLTEVKKEGQNVIKQGDC